MSGYFTTDRARKYGWGVPRLALLTLFAFEVVPRRFLAASAPDAAAAASLALAPYLASMRWLGHAYMGSIGAGVNVQVLGFLGNLAMLLLAAAACVWDVSHDYSILVYLVKTFSGDQLAGKLDTPEWKLVLLFTFGLFGPGLWLAAGSNAAALDAARPYLRVLPVLFLIQAVCEFGDAHLEHHPLVGKFFRHRYGFEAFTLAALTCMPGGITPPELRVVQYDLVICLFYRVSNLCIIMHKNGLVAAAVAAVATAARKLCFRVFGALSGRRLVNVTDAEIATAVLRASDVKGDALERHVATPAWRPLLSLESVDGPLYKSMLRDFHALVKALPPPSEIARVAERRVDALLRELGADGGAVEGAERRASSDSDDVPVVEVSVSAGASKASSERRVVDADAVARLSLATFVEYVFGREWDASFEPLVAASWEWRKEIAVRGRANPALKREAVGVVLDLLRSTPKLWALHGEDWTQPRYYSLILQPFIISPAINVGDIAVAMKAHPDLKLEEAMRRMHPFPIFERWVERDVVVRGRVAVRAQTQVIMFTSDLRDAKVPWPVFGAGPRACAGTKLALGLLQTMRERLASSSAFAPERGHRFSGRNNDGVTTPAEAWYFVKTVVPIVLGFRRGEGESDDALERAAAKALKAE